MTIAEQIAAFCALVRFRPTGPQNQTLVWLASPPGARVDGPLTLPAAAPEVSLVLGRASGKSSVCGLLASYAALTWPGTEVLWISPNMRLSDDVGLARVRQFCRPLREALEEGSDFLRRGSTAARLVFKNGSVICGLPADERNLRGRGPRILILDEAAQLPEHGGERASLRDVLTSVRPRQRAEHGDRYKIILASTPRRNSGYLYELCTNPASGVAVVQAGTATMRPDLGGRDLRRGLSAVEYEREIEAQWIGDDGGPFDIDELRECMRPLAEIPVPAAAPILAIDLGVRRDRTGLCIASRDGAARVVVHHLESRKVSRDLNHIASHVAELSRAWRPHRVVCDQFGADGLLTVLGAHGVANGVSHAWTAENRAAAYSLLAGMVEARTLVLPTNPALLREAAGLRVTMTRSGARKIEAPRNASGHADMLDALLLAASQLRARVPVRLLVDDRPDVWRPLASCGGIA